MNDSQMIQQTHDMVTQLVTMVGNMAKELSEVKSEVKTIRERQEEQDKVVDILSAKTIRLQAKSNI